MVTVMMAANDPKHTSVAAKQFLEENGINWWRTPAESPDLNPIENLWHELKEYIRRDIKPKTKDQLVEGKLYTVKGEIIVGLNNCIFADIWVLNIFGLMIANDSLPDVWSRVITAQ